jgi:hypothetical protein
MADLGAVLEHLKAERAKLDKAIEALSGIAGSASGGGRGGKRKLSAVARARIAAAQRARWAKFKAKKARVDWRAECPASLTNGAGHFVLVLGDDLFTARESVATTHGRPNSSA